MRKSSGGGSGYPSDLSTPGALQFRRDDKQDIDSQWRHLRTRRIQTTASRGTPIPAVEPKQQSAAVAKPIDAAAATQPPNLLSPKSTCY
ncbi:hypothetical protein AOLI_G00201010 [Acnodon oligacanthus]